MYHPGSLHYQTSVNNVIEISASGSGWVGLHNFIAAGCKRLWKVLSQSRRIDIEVRLNYRPALGIRCQEHFNFAQDIKGWSSVQFDPEKVKRDHMEGPYLNPHAGRDLDDAGRQPAVFGIDQLPILYHIESGISER